MLVINAKTIWLPGEEIVAPDDIYGGSDRLLSQATPKSGVVVKLVLPFLFSFSFLFKKELVMLLGSNP